MKQAATLQADIEDELEALRTTVDELEATVDAFERQLLESKLGGDSLVDVEVSGTPGQPAAAD